MPPSPREPLHFAYIDALRGYAFLGVLCVHATLACGDFPAAIITKEGGYGVQLFFLASAITLCFSMSTRREGKMDYVNFYLRRVFRIVPLFWLGMLVYWTVPGVIPRAWMTMWAPNGVNGLYFVLTAFFLHGWHPYTFNSIVPGGWSIAVEMTFYVFFPFLFHHITTLTNSAKCVVFGLALTVFVRFVTDLLLPHLYPGIPDDAIMEFFLVNWFPSQVIVFLLGIFVYFLLRQPVIQQFHKDRFWATWTLIISLVFLFSQMHHDAGGFMPPLLVVLSMAGVIVALAGNAVPLTVNPLICHLGKLSYSCYLTHFAAIGIVMRLFHAILPRYAVVMPQGNFVLDFGNPLFNTGAFILVSSVSLVVTVIFSTVTYNFVEKPGIALGRSLIRAINNKKNDAPDKNAAVPSLRT